MPGKSTARPAGEMLLPSQLPQMKKKLRLKCGKCGHAGRYNVGCVLFNPDRAEDDAGSLVDSLSFSGYFRCTKCNSAWPWDFPTRTSMELMSEITRMVFEMSSHGVSTGAVVLFDGTICRSAADGEDYLLERIAEEPDDFYLHNRLGNLYRHHGMFEQARASYERAIELNPRDAESWYNVANVHQRVGRNEEAVHGFQQSLRYACHCQHMDPDERRCMVRDALEQLFDFFDPEDGVQFLPPVEPLPDSGRSDPDRPVVYAFEFDLGTEEGWDKMTDMYFYGTVLPDRGRRRGRTLPQGVGRTDAPHDRAVIDRRIPRNSPCPCGSGRKFKNCCGKRARR